MIDPVLLGQGAVGDVHAVEEAAGATRFDDDGHLLHAGGALQGTQPGVQLLGSDAAGDAALDADLVGLAVVDEIGDEGVVVAHRARRCAAQVLMAFSTGPRRSQPRRRPPPPSPSASCPMTGAM